MPATLAAPVALLAGHFPASVELPAGRPGPVPTVLWVGVTSLWLLGSLVVLGWSAHRGAGTGALRRAAPIAWAGSAGSLLVQAAVLGSNAGGSVARAGLPWWSTTGPVLAVAIAAGGIGWVVTGTDPDHPRSICSPAADLPRHQLSPHGRGIWCRSLFSPAPLTVAVLLGAAGTTALIVDGFGLGPLITVAVAAHLSMQSWVRVRVDEQGITMTQPLAGQRFITVPMDQITQAHADPAAVPHARRGLIRTSTRLGYLVRTQGPHLRVDLSGDRCFLLSVDRPHVLAGLLNSLIDRRHRPTTTGGRTC